MLVNKGHKLILGREKGRTYVYGLISRDHDVAVELDGLEDVTLFETPTEELNLPIEHHLPNTSIPEIEGRKNLHAKTRNFRGDG